MRSRVTVVVVSVGLSVCLSVRGVFFETASFKSYGVKRKRKSQYAN